jgi:hypothetical protein
MVFFTYDTMLSSKIPYEFALRSIQLTTLARSHRWIPRVKVGLGEQWIFLGNRRKDLGWNVSNPFVLD